MLWPRNVPQMEPNSPCTPVRDCVGKSASVAGHSWLLTTSTSTNTSERGSWGTGCFSNHFRKASIPASQPQDTWRTWPCLSWAFQSMSQQTLPKHCFFYSGFANPRHLFSDFACKRQNFMHPWGSLRNWQPLTKWSILYFSTVFSVLLLQRLQPYFLQKLIFSASRVTRGLGNKVKKNYMNSRINTQHQQMHLPQRT